MVMPLRGLLMRSMCTGSSANMGPTSDGARDVLDVPGRAEQAVQHRADAAQLDARLVGGVYNQGQICRAWRSLGRRRGSCLRCEGDAGQPTDARSRSKGRLPSTSRAVISEEGSSGRVGHLCPGLPSKWYNSPPPARPRMSPTVRW